MSVLVPDGMFAMACPRCHVALTIDPRGNGRCAACLRTFAPRFGMLVPLDDEALGAGAEEAAQP